jgi:hypothetical protein
MSELAILPLHDVFFLHCCVQGESLIPLSNLPAEAK